MPNIRFVVTNAGLEAAINAEQQGLKVVINKFTIGTAYGYEPSVDDVDLHGNQLYTGEPYKYRYISPNTRLFVCQLPPEIGPFEFGEIGLWMDTGVLFALCSFEGPIAKYSSIESTISSSVTFNCILTLAQGASSVTINYEDNPQAGNEIENITNWAQVTTPSSMYPQNTKELIVNELSRAGNQTLLIRDATNDRWNVASTYYPIVTRVEMVNLGSTYVDISNSMLKTVVTDDNYYLLQFAYNTYRLATGSANGNNIRFSFADPLPESIVKSNMLNVYSDDILAVVNTLGPRTALWA